MRLSNTMIMNCVSLSAMLSTCRWSEFHQQAAFNTDVSIRATLLASSASAPPPNGVQSVQPFLQGSLVCQVPSVIWHCWLGIRNSIRPVKIDWWGVGVVICLQRGADCLHMVQLTPLPPQTLSSLAPFKSRLVLPFCTHYHGCPGKEAVKRV